MEHIASHIRLTSPCLYTQKCSCSTPRITATFLYTFLAAIGDSDLYTDSAALSSYAIQPPLSVHFTPLQPRMSSTAAKGQTKQTVGKKKQLYNKYYVYYSRQGGATRYAIMFPLQTVEDSRYEDFMVSGIPPSMKSRPVNVTALCACADRQHNRRENHEENTVQLRLANPASVSPEFTTQQILPDVKDQEDQRRLHGCKISAQNCDECSKVVIKDMERPPSHIYCIFVHYIYMLFFHV